VIYWILGIIVALIGLNFLYQHWKRNIWFFRDPPITSLGDSSVIVSPCDGMLMYVKKIENGQVECEKLGTKIKVEEISKSDDKPQKGLLFGIYMSPFDVHFNYAPISGKITKVVHTQAKLNLPMVDLWEYIQFCWLRRAVNLLGAKYQLVNERNTIFIEGSIKVAMIEIADKVVNKIDCFVSENDYINQGQKVSFIKRGSQVDLVLWGDDYDVLVRPGLHVTGAETVLARVGHQTGHGAGA